MEVHDNVPGGVKKREGAAGNPSAERSAEHQPLTDAQVHDPFDLPKDAAPVRKVAPPLPDFAPEAELGGIGSAHDAWYRLSKGV